MPSPGSLNDVAAALDVDFTSSSVQLYDATALVIAVDRTPFAAGLIDLSPFQPVLVTRINSVKLASGLKIALGRMFGNDHIVALVCETENSDLTIERTPLRELDQVPVERLTAIWIEPLPEIAASRAFSGLARIVARLRAPGGCPWDQKQDARSLVNSILEEAYEAVEAIEAGDPAHAAEELGDLLLLIAMEAQIAEEAGEFTIEDVIEGISSKLIRRHPHVFGDKTAENADDVVGIWQKVKATEGKKPKPSHPLDRYPAPMPVSRRLIDLFTVSNPTGSVDPDEIGNQLFSLTKSAIDAGFDPEKLILEAAKRAIPEAPAS